MERFFTSESVTKGHPDKVCDQIADGILDELLSKDSSSRVACEVAVEPGAVHIMGEVTSKADVDYTAVARKIIREIGYTKEEYGFTDNAAITCSIHKQSPDIGMGVNNACDEQGSSGAGDQGMMFGYASAETVELMPLAHSLARKLTSRLTQARETGELGYLRPDGKSQVTVEYDGRKARRIEAVVLSAQHDDNIALDRLRRDVMDHVIMPVLGDGLVDGNTKFYINPTGRFVLGGPAADTGVTGRKIIVDTYGGYAHHGGGAFSGKDPSKVDRSAAYAMRNVARTVVGAGLAAECELQVSYAIGVAKPLSLNMDTFGTARVPEQLILDCIRDNTDLRPDAIIRRFSLRRPIYLDTARYGHFGIDGYPWEKPDETLMKALEKLM